MRTRLKRKPYVEEIFDRLSICDLVSIPEILTEFFGHRQCIRTIVNATGSLIFQQSNQQQQQQQQQQTTGIYTHAFARTQDHTL